MTEVYNEVFDVIKASLWSKEALNINISDECKKELMAHEIEGLTIGVYSCFNNERYERIARFVRMVTLQSELIELLKNRGIDAVILKGTASGIYYPKPYLRTYGDIDILVHPDCYYNAIGIFQESEIRRKGDVGVDETTFYKNGFFIELHRRPLGLERAKEGTYICNYVLSGMNNIQKAIIDQPLCSFSMLPWEQNGLELIWHIRVHLYNGLGLRQVIDWMMFVYRCLQTDEECNVFCDILKNAGLLTLAKAVTRVCQIYLGLKGNLVWCSDADMEVCEELLTYILDQGNFGAKRRDDKAIKVLTKYRSPLLFLRGMQQKGMREWNLAARYKALQPIAWVYTGVKGISLYLRKGGREKLISELRENNRRRELFDQLYEGERIIQRDIVKKKSNNSINKRIKNRFGGKLSLKRTLRKWNKIIKKTPLRVPLYYAQNFFLFCNYMVLGKPHISDEDIQNVENEVTFIYKSFNRQKRAIKLYHCIKKYYPKATVIIADDSMTPLSISDLRKGDRVIHLPFNSGLSRGLKEALDCVNTQFVMRLDDDLMLTPSTKVHEHLAFLKSHDEIDLIAVQMTHIHPEKRAAIFSQIKMNKTLLVPAGTVIEGRTVVYKTPNVYLARTQSLRNVGFDPNIRMLDHHEFFYRAAGKIVCVQDPNSYVMHCHNYFEKNNYDKYRNDYVDDLVYIKNKHGRDYG